MFALYKFRGSHLFNLPPNRVRMHKSDSRQDHQYSSLCRYKYFLDFKQSRFTNLPHPACDIELV